MQTIRLCNAIVTLCVVVGMLSLTMVEDQPSIWAVFGLCIFTGAVAMEAKQYSLTQIRSNADEDRPE